MYANEANRPSGYQDMIVAMICCLADYLYHNHKKNYLNCGWAMMSKMFRNFTKA